MKVVFFVTPDFAKDPLLFLLENKIDVVGVVTQPDKRKGRGKKSLPCPVKNICLEKNLNIPVFQPEKASNPDFLEDLKKLKADLFIIVAYGQILTNSLLEIPIIDCINVHGSLLPKYRGAAPIQRSILAGDKETGITIMRVIRKLDAGQMLLKEVVSISQEMDFGQLEKKLSDISGPLLLQVIKQYETNSVQLEDQDDSLATYAHKISTEELKIDFSKDVTTVHNQIRAFSPKPGAFCQIMYKGQVKRLKILKAKIVDIPANPFATHTYSKDQWIVGCNDKGLKLLVVQLEGKKAMDFTEFYKGSGGQPTILPSS